MIAAGGAEAVDESAGGGPWFGGLDLIAGEAEAFGEFKPELGVVGRAGFLVDEVGEKVLADGLVASLGVDGGKIRGEGGDVPVVLSGVVAECVESELAAGPGLVEGMLEEVLGGDFGFDLVKNVYGFAIHGDSFGSLEHFSSTASGKMLCGVMFGQINRSAGWAGERVSTDRG